MYVSSNSKHRRYIASWIHFWSDFWTSFQTDCQNETIFGFPKIGGFKISRNLCSFPASNWKPSLKAIALTFFFVTRSFCLPPFFVPSYRLCNVIVKTAKTLALELFGEQNWLNLWIFKWKIFKTASCMRPPVLSSCVLILHTHVSCEQGDYICKARISRRIERHVPKKRKINKSTSVYQTNCKHTHRILPRLLLRTWSVSWSQDQFPEVNTHLHF